MSSVAEHLYSIANPMATTRVFTGISSGKTAFLFSISGGVGLTGQNTFSLDVSTVDFYVLQAFPFVLDGNSLGCMTQMQKGAATRRFLPEGFDLICRYCSEIYIVLLFEPADLQ